MAFALLLLAISGVFTLKGRNNTSLFPCSTIGDFSVMATGSVLTKDVPSEALEAGVPEEVKKPK